MSPKEARASAKALLASDADDFGCAARGSRNAVKRGILML